jgi:hypothetical protein
MNRAAYTGIAENLVVVISCSAAVGARRLVGALDPGVVYNIVNVVRVADPIGSSNEMDFIPKSRKKRSSTRARN